MRSTFEKIKIERQWTKSYISKILSNITERMERRLPDGEEIALTAFQKKALADDQFWRDWNPDAPVRNLMVQGATSAGKTLLSELNILDTLQNEKKAIVLVPLKAMVHERTKQFRYDMGGEASDGEIKVFGSSSDYMENDERLLAGEYDVAIMVYEKFFAMISQSDSQLMKKCGLLVVDELTSIALDQRGPKLEISLEIVRKKHPDTRILCLATCDCGTRHICEWLDIERPIISTARPIALEEHILMLNGTGRYRIIPKEHESALEGSPGYEEIETGSEKIVVDGYNGSLNIRQKKEALLLATMKRIFSEAPDTRVLVFVAAHKSAAKIAGMLKDHSAEWMPRQIGNCSETFLRDLQACEHDEGQEALINTLIPAGIAYHHAGLSTNLRELIEAQFSSRTSHLRVIVATETLTVGINMPFDAMIMVDHEVWRGQSEAVPLNQQEYRNYIGRAGRLGQSNRVGKTYLFVESESESDYYWKSYNNCAEVKSALVKEKEAGLAPYYLSLLINKIADGGNTFGATVRLEDLQTIYEGSLSRRCSKKERINVQELHDQLYNSYLVTELTNPSALGPVGRNARKEEVFQIERFGTHMAPYALSTETCCGIYYYFYEGQNGTFPTAIKREDIDSDRYLLEILYHICWHHSEIKESTNLRYPMSDNNVTLSFSAKKKVLDSLRRLTEQADKEGRPLYTLWCDAGEFPEEEHRVLRESNHIWQLLNESNLAEEKGKLQAAMRAIVLFHWTQGMPLKEINKKTGFGDFTNLVGGDIERLAEVVSFHMDAIYKCLSSVKVKDGVSEEERLQVLRAFYVLTKRVKYGMSKDLVVLANKHVHGLDRHRLLKFQKAAEQMGLDPLRYLYLTPVGSVPENVLTASQHRQLLQEMENRGAANSIDVLIRIMKNDASTCISEKVFDAIRKIWCWKTDDTEDMGDVPVDMLCDALETIFATPTFDAVNPRIRGGISSAKVELRSNDGGACLRIGVCTSIAIDKVISEFFKKDMSEDGLCPAARLLIVPAELDKTKMLELKEQYGADAVLDNVYLAFALANILRLAPPQDTVFPFLADLRGIFTEAERNYCPIMRYVRNTPREKTADFYLIHNGAEAQFGQTVTTSELIRTLTNEKFGDYEELSWSAVPDSYDFSERPTIILLNRSDIVRSENLTRFFYRMRSQDFKNCLLVLNSQRELEKWENETNAEARMYNQWDPRNNRIRKFVPEALSDALEEICTFIKVWHREEFLIGISYAHFHSQAPDYPKSDRALLEKLVGMLRDEYGEDRILYDRYARAGKLFGENRAIDISLNAYRECKYYLILWNWWTKNEPNCERERKVIFEEYRKNNKKYRFLVTGNEKDPPLEESWRSFSDMLTQDSLERIFGDIKDAITKLL